MNLAKLCANGQITVPVEVRRRLHLVPGDKVLFLEKGNGEIEEVKAELAAVTHAQDQCAGAARDFGVTDEGDVQALVDEMRGSRS